MSHHSTGSSSHQNKLLRINAFNNELPMEGSTNQQGKCKVRIKTMPMCCVLSTPVMTCKCLHPLSHRATVTIISKTCCPSMQTPSSSFPYHLLPQLLSMALLPLANPKNPPYWLPFTGALAPSRGLGGPGCLVLRVRGKGYSSGSSSSLQTLLVKCSSR